MGLPEKYDNRLRKAIGLRAVWLPGREVGLGDIMQRRDGIFEHMGRLCDYGIGFGTNKASEKLSVTLQAKGVSSTVIQAGAEVDPAKLDAKIKAELKINFKAKDTYFVRTPELVGTEIMSLMKLGVAIKRLPDWRYREYYVACAVYRAKEFVFLGSESKNTTVRFGGQGSAIRHFLEVGASAGLERSSSSGIGVEIVGKGGPIAMRVVRFQKDGRVY